MCKWTMYNKWPMLYMKYIFILIPEKIKKKKQLIMKYSQC